MSNLGFFCCNTDKPERYTAHGFLIGAAHQTRVLSAASIEASGFVGIYTPAGSKEHVKLWRKISGLPVPDRHASWFPGLNYEIDQERR